MKLVSFGYRYRHPAPLGASLVLDARCLTEDPAEKEELGKLTGLDPAVWRYLKDLPDVQAFLSAACQAGASFRDAQYRTSQPEPVIAIGCHSGRHRSVFLVERLKDILPWPCTVEHLDMLRTPDEDLAPDVI